MQASVPVASRPVLVATDVANEPYLEDPVEHAERERRATRRLAIAMGLAILLHLVVVAITVIAPDWWRHAELPKVIPITLVAEPEPPPPPPPPAEKPAPAPPPPAPAPQPFAESGPDQKTSSAPAEKPPQPAPDPAPSTSEPAPDPAPEPTPTPPKAPEPLPAPQPALPAPEAPKPVPKPLPAPKAPQPPSKLVTPPKAAPPKATPKPKSRNMVRLAPSGEAATSGDVYLNQVVQWIQRRRKYPEYFRQDGLVGTASFTMTWARNGEIVNLSLSMSSGDSAIDLYAEEVVRRSSPLPPIPPNFPGATLTGQLYIPVQP